jgi:hypothetical protein
MERGSAIAKPRQASRFVQMVKRVGAWECACGFDTQVPSTSLTDHRINPYGWQAVRGFEDYMSEGYADEVRYCGERCRA